MITAQDSTAEEPALGRLSLRRVPLILMYHSVAAVPEDPNHVCVTPARFAEQMAWLASRGLRGVSIGTLVAALRDGRARGLVGITFDDGYDNILGNAVPELLRHHFTATMFIVSSRIGGTNEWDGEPVWPLMTAGQVAEVAAAGMEIGSHSATHAKLPGLSEERLRAEVHDSRARLGELLGQPVRGFAYPYGKMDAAVRQAVRDAGYQYACSVETRPADMGDMALPRMTIGERDTAARLAAKKRFYRGYTAVVGSRAGQQLIRRLAAIA